MLYIAKSSQSPTEITLRGAHIVQWTMVLRGPQRSVDRSDPKKNLSAYAD